MIFFFFSSRRRHTSFSRDWSSDVCSSDLVASSGDSAAARLQRSTPPAASSRATASTRCRHVSQYVVGNGLPSSSNAACSVTAGRPYGQRTTTRRNARGRRPSCRSTTARSSSIGGKRSASPPPRLDPLDDEEMLPRAHVAERASLARERVDARGGFPSTLGLLGRRLTPHHLRAARPER